MPQATETFYVIEPGDADSGTPALALVPGAFREGFQHDGPGLLVEVEPVVGGMAVRAGMRLVGQAHIFVEDGGQVRPSGLEVIADEPNELDKPVARGTIWD